MQYDKSCLTLGMQITSTDFLIIYKCGFILCSDNILLLSFTTLSGSHQPLQVQCYNVQSIDYFQLEFITDIYI